MKSFEQIEANSIAKVITLIDMEAATTGDTWELSRRRRWCFEKLNALGFDIVNSGDDPVRI